jgi:hypothetical protein
VVTLCTTRFKVTLCTTRFKVTLCTTRFKVTLCTTRFKVTLCTTRFKVTLCTTRFQVTKFYVLPTVFSYVFYMDRKINSDFFSTPKWLVLVTERECLQSGTNWILKYNSGQFSSFKTVTWLRRLVAGLSRRRPGFYPESVHMRFVVAEVVLGQVSLRVLRVFTSLIHFTNIPYSFSSTCFAYLKVKRGPNLEILQKAMLFRKLESIG